MIFRVSGLKYHTFEFPQEKEYVFLVPEPENKFDSNAVAVYNRFHQRIGYCPIKNRYNFKVLELVKLGRPFVCQVTLSNRHHQVLLVDIIFPNNEKLSMVSLFPLKKYRLN